MKSKTQNGNENGKRKRKVGSDFSRSRIVPPSQAGTQRFSPGFPGFVRFCSGLTLDTGEPLILEPFQKRIIRGYFAGVRSIIAILPFGNAKSTLLAALGLHHMLTTERAECIVAAAAADQAAIIFDQMAGLIDASDLPLDAKRGIRAVYHRGTGPNRKPLGRIRVISADVKKNSGAIPTLVLVDELQAQDGYLYTMFRGRLKKRNAQMLSISNAGWDPESFLGRLRRQAHEHETFERKGKMNHARMGSMEFFEWCLTEQDDADNMVTVKKANPLKHVTREILQEWHDEAGLIRAEWLRGACGLWTSVETPWIEERVWNALAVDIGGIEEGEPVWVAVRDGAVAIVAQRGEGVACRAVIGPDDWVATEQLLLELVEIYDVIEIAYDAQSIGILADQLIARGLPMIEVPHRPERLTIASATIQRLVSQELLHHDGDPALKAHVLAGTTKQSERGWRLVMTPENRALIALALASHQATQGAPPDERFIMPAVG